MKSKILNKILKALEQIEFGELELNLPDGKSYKFAGTQAGAKADITIKQWHIFTEVAARGDIALAQGYSHGSWESDDLESFFKFVLQNDQVLNKFIYGNNIYKIIAALVNLSRRNSLKGSKRNIAAHYDLGNEFYSLWLDKTMTYSSALFKEGQQDLAAGQAEKYNRIISRLKNNSGSILEIGCGWGGFAEQALKQGDYDIKGLTLSKEQQEFARQRLAEQPVDIAYQDYRKEKSKFDHIVSIEMFEAVGEKYWPIYFKKIKECLSNKGNAVIQTITIGEQYFKDYRKSGDFIRSFIFPGGMLPSKQRFSDEAARSGLKINDEFSFGKDYAKTLSLWLKSFEEQISAVKQLGFNENFIRIWRLYLAACSASFAVGRTNVVQYELVHV